MKTYALRSKPHPKPPYIEEPWEPIAWEASRRWPGPPYLVWPEGVDHADPAVVRQLLHEVMWLLQEPGLHPALPLAVLESHTDRVPALVRRVDVVLDKVERSRQARLENIDQLEEEAKHLPTWAAHLVRFILRKEDDLGEDDLDEDDEGEGEGGEGEEDEGERSGEDQKETEGEVDSDSGGGGEGGEGTAGKKGEGEGEGEGSDEGEGGEGGESGAGENDAAGEEPGEKGAPSGTVEGEVEADPQGEGEDAKQAGEDGGGEEGEPETSDNEPRPLPNPGKVGKARALLAALLPDLRHYGTPDLDPMLSEQQIARLAARLEALPNVDKLLALIGRLSSSAWMPAKRVASAAREDIRDVTLGGDFSLMLPSELVRFAIPSMAPDAYADLIENRLNILEFEGTEPRGRGPILLAIDVSPSMEVAADGEFKTMSRLTVAGMISLAMVRAASIQKRSVVIVGFAGKVIWTKTARTLPEYVALQEALLDLRVGGMDTQFDAPLQVLLQATSQHAGGDLVFLTDGASLVSSGVVQQVLRAKARDGLRLFTLLLGEGYGLETLSNLTIPVTKVSSLEHMSREVTRVR